MKFKFTFLLFSSILVIFQNLLIAQNFPQRGSNEPPGNLLCGEWVAGSNQGFTPDIASYFFPCGPVNNSQWFLVSPRSNTLEIEFETTDCFGGIGFELAVYDANLNLVGACLSAPIIGFKETLFLDNLSPGGAYSIVVDGRSNGICEFELRVLGNSYEPIPAAEILPLQPAACPGSIVCYSARPTSSNVINYIWTVSTNGRFVGSHIGREVCIEWLRDGNAQIGMTPVGNGLCGTFGARSLNTIQVFTPRDTTFLPTQEFCAEQFPLSDADYCQTSICPGVISGPGNYCVTLTSGIGCDSVVCYRISAKPTPTILISKEICSGGEFYFRNEAFAAPGIYQRTLPNFDGIGCDTSLMIQLVENNRIRLDSVRIDSVLCNVSCVPITPFLNSLSDLTFLWTTLDGRINGSDSVLVPEVCKKGIYTLEIRDTLTAETCFLDFLVPQAVDTGLQVQFTVQNVVCVGDSVDIVVQNFPSGSILNWTLSDFPPGFLSGTGPFRVAFSEPGIYSLGLQAEKNGCFSNLQTEIIQVDGLLESPTITCTPTLNSLHFDWQNILGANQYNISINGVNPQSITVSEYLVSGLQPGQIVTISVAAIGQTVCPPVISSLTCQAKDCPKLNIRLPQTVFCANDAPMDLNFSQLPSVPCIWTGRGIDNNCRFNPALAGLGSSFIKYDFSDNGCRFVDSFRVYVESLPEFTASLKPDLWNLGARGSIELNVLTPYSDITWRKSNGSFFSNRKDLINVLPGQYCATVTGENGCQKTQCYNLVSGIYRVPEFVYTCQGQSVNIRVRPSTGATFSWSPTNSLSCSDCPNPIATPNYSTKYTVTATLPDGQQSSTDVWVIVFLPPFCPVSNISHSKELNLFESTEAQSNVSAVENFELEKDTEVNIFPNPSEGLFTIESDGPIERVEIFDWLGKSVYLSETKNTREEINLENFPEGYYWISIGISNTVVKRKICILRN